MPWRTCLRTLGIATATLIVLFAIALNLARMVTPLLDSHHQVFEQWVSHFIQRPVKIGRITATWYGFEPAVKLDNLQVLTSDHHAFLEIKHFTVAIDLWSTFWNRRWLPGRLMIDGLNLEVQQDKSNQLHLAHAAGIQLPANSLEQSGFKSMVEWLLTQAEVRVKHVNILWHGPNDFVLPMQNVRLDVENSEFNHHIVGTIELAQTVRSSFHFIVDLHSAEIYSQQFSANVFINAHHVLLPQWVKLPIFAEHLRGLHVMSGEADAQFWGQWRLGDLQEAQTMLSGQRIAFMSPELNRQLFIKHFTANTLWQKQKHGWQLSADKIKLNVNHRQWRDNQLLVRYKKPVDNGWPEWQIALSYLRLSDAQFVLSNLQHVPQQWRQWIGNLQPQGQIHQMTLALTETGAAEPYKLDEFSAVFHHVSWHGFQTVPSVDGMSGQVSWMPGSGHLILDSPGATIDTIQWLKRAQKHFKQLQLAMSWQKQVNGWAVALQQLNVDDGDLSAQLQPSEIHEDMSGLPVVEISGSFRFKDLTQSAEYVPLGVLPPKITGWLQRAFLRGEIRHGAFHLQGPLHKFPFDHDEGELTIDLEPVDMSFQYAPHWPAITHADGELHLHDRQLNVAVGFAKTAGATLRNVTASIQDLARGHLVVGGEYGGTMHEAQTFLQQTPLGIGKQLGALQLTGLAQGDLRLDVALRKPHMPIKLLGHLYVKQGELSLPGWNTELKKIDGLFTYSEKSCVAKGVNAELLKRPVKMAISTVHGKGEPEAIQVAIGGDVDLALLGKHYKIPQLPYIHGATDYRALLNLYPFHSKNTDNLSVMSDLRGIAIDMPPPLKKAADKPRHLSVRVDLNTKKPLHVKASYGPKLTADVSFKSNKSAFKFTRGEVRIGGRRAKLPKAKGLIVAVNLPYINGRQWLQFYQRWQNQTIAKTFNIMPRVVDVRLSRLILWNMAWSGLHLRAQPLPGGWFAQINSRHVVGQVNVPANLKRGVINAEFQKFDYEPLSKQGSTIASPKQVPAIDFTANELLYNHYLLGHAHAVLQPFKKGVKLTTLTVKSPNIDAAVKGEWTIDQGKQSVISAGSLKVKNWGHLFRRWKLTDVLAGGQGMIGFQLKWPGRVTNFKMAKTSGQINVALADGRILQVSKQTQAELGLGRFLNVLSLQSLPRRLVLNFGDIGKKGFEFDQAYGTFSLKNGVATTKNVKLEGDLAKIKMQGKVGLAKKTYNLHMEIRPNVTGSLPFIATVTGGPLAGAIAWVVNKLFVGPTVGRAAMVKYNITGGWDHPVIKKVG
ncbi:MAG: YhdP family protein [Coxiellaceae bacterium]|nr:YhdP family protein [Coxiellaceae bacterium]